MILFIYQFSKQWVGGNQRDFWVLWTRGCLCIRYVSIHHNIDLILKMRAPSGWLWSPLTWPHYLSIAFLLFETSVPRCSWIFPAPVLGSAISPESWYLWVKCYLDTVIWILRMFIACGSSLPLDLFGEQSLETYIFKEDKNS